jgi:large subunit ribosomal protein L17
MRHQRVINHLGRTSSHRKAMLANMATSLIMHKRITTTTAKAKALRTYIEPLITKSKEDSTHSRRIVFSYLQNKTAVAELFREVSPKVAERPGGYTRILKTGNRIGDNAEMCILELVDFNEIMLAGEAAKAKASTRRRRSAGKKKAETEAATDVKAKKSQPVVTETEPAPEETGTEATEKNE